MKTKFLSGVAAVVFASSIFAGAAFARDQIRIVGSSTVFPFTQAAAEQFANMTGNPAPVVESTGTGGGMKIFCEGVGEGQTGHHRRVARNEGVGVQGLSRGGR